MHSQKYIIAGMHSQNRGSKRSLSTLVVLKFLQILKEKVTFSILTPYFYNTPYITLFILQYILL
jgi:hypothetical protein